MDVFGSFIRLYCIKGFVKERRPTKLTLSLFVICSKKFLLTFLFLGSLLDNFLVPRLYLSITNR